MCLEGLAKFEKAKVLTEVPPVKNEKGEITEVQVSEEGEVFGPDQFLEELAKHQSECPRCLVPIKFDHVQQSNGRTWNSYCCLTR